MGFLANAEPSAHAATPGPEQPIGNDGFFPTIDMRAMREAMRLDGTVTDARLRPAIIAAMHTVNLSLAEWRVLKIFAGFNSLEEVPDSRIDGESRLLALYRRAVYSSAKADLIERYRDIDTTASALADKKHMEWLDVAPADQRRNAHWAIADILGRPRVTVELI
jgi:hypothetical protein